MIKIVSTIKKSRDSRTQPWIVSTAAVDNDKPFSQHYVMGASDLAHTWPDALEIAAEQREAIDYMLMNSVYADRLARRDRAQP